MDKQRLDEIRERAEAVPTWGDNFKERLLDAFYNEDSGNFIAYARQDIPALLAYVEELEKQIAEMVWCDNA